MDFFRFGGGFGSVLEAMLGAMLAKISIIWPLFGKLVEITKILKKSLVFTYDLGFSAFQLPPKINQKSCQSGLDMDAKMIES